MDDRHRADGRDQSLSLILPAYNEEAGIRQAILEADAALARLGCDYEILVVDDGSRDATAAVVTEAMPSCPRLRLVRHAVNRGYGAALRTGFEAARGARVAFTDADCQFDLADLASLLPLAEQHSVVVGYRIDRQDPWRRRFLSWGYNTLVRLLLGTRVRDCDCALKVFRRDALAKLLPETSRFFVNTEMLTRARQHGLAVTEVGVQHRPRIRGSSKVSLLDVPRTLATLLPFWWSKVLFPGEAAHPTPALPSWDWGLATLIVVAALLFFARLGCPLQEPQEARYAEIPRQMLAEGRLLVPVLHGQPYYDKPPLLYWLVMGSYALLGVHDWAARLVPSTAAFLCVLVTYWWGKRVVGLRAALIGALILCLSGRFVQLARLLTMDSLLCLWTLVALATAHFAIRGARLRWGWWLVSAGACGLGLLTKGPVALALVAVPVLSFQLIDARAVGPRIAAWAAYLLVAVGLAGPWYGAMATTDPAFLGYFFWYQNALRYVAAFDHPEPFWFYLPSLLLGMLPWTLLLPALGKFLTRRSVKTAARRPAELGFFLLAFTWSLAFYSVAGCKRASYILPAMPLLALALGCYLDAVLPREKLLQARAMLVRFPSELAYRATLLVLALGAAGGVVAVCAALSQPGYGLLLTSLAALVLALVLHQRRGRRAAASWALCGAVTFSVLFAGVHLLLPSYARRFSLRGQVRPHVALGRDLDVPIMCYPHRWDSVSFYLRRNDVRVYTPQRRHRLMTDLESLPQALLFVKSDHSYQDLLRDLPPMLEFVPRGRRGTVIVGLVRPRQEVPSSALARR